MNGFNFVLFSTMSFFSSMKSSNLPPLHHYSVIHYSFQKE